MAIPEPYTDDLIPFLERTLRSLEIEPEQFEQAMMKLTSYITRRDHKIFNHAFNLGKEAHGKNLKSDS